MIGRAFDYLMLLDWRATELLVASLLIVRGGAILFAGGMSAATYDPFRTIMPDQGWGLVSIITGVFWIFAVKRNGHMHQSPALRASAGVFAVLVTGLLSFAFVIAGSANAASVYSVIFVFTMLAALRSMVDRERRRV